MKRMLTMMLALLMTAALAAGCAGTGTPSQAPSASAPAASSAAAPSAAPTAAASDDPAAPDAREVITISINTADEGVVFDAAGDELAKLIEDRFRIRFEPRNITDTSEYVLLAASDDLPDVFYNEPLYYIANYINFIQDGYVKDIPQDLIDKYENIKNIISTSDLCTASKDLFGGNYVLPKPDSMDRTLYIAERRGIFYRKDWAEKFGITARPTNVDEFYEMIKHFTDDDPDGNGTKDTWGFTTGGPGEVRLWFIAWGVDNQNWVKDTDGTWTHGQLTESNIEPLKFFRKIYQEGYFDPEFASINYVQAQQKLAGGTVGAITRNADTSWISGVINEQFGSANEGNPFDKVGLIPILAKDANSQPYMHQYMWDMCGTQFNSAIDDDMLDRYLAFHDWCMTEEGKSYKLGFEGVDWQKTADGDYEAILDAAGNKPVLTDKYKSIGLLNMPSWAFELEADHKWPMERFGQYAEEIRDLSDEARALRNPNAFPYTMKVKLISTESKLNADTFNFSNEIAPIIMGTDPVEDMFAAMVQKAMDSGFREAIADVNQLTADMGL